MKTGVDLIAEERLRQINVEDFTLEGDKNRSDSLIRAAEAYSEHARTNHHKMPVNWPWMSSEWKPGDDPVRDLVKAGALIAAAIDSIQGEDDEC